MGERLYPRDSVGGITGDSSGGDPATFAEADTNEDGSLSEEELTALTIAQIKAIAEDKGYTITATRKADIIAEFLEEQTAALGGG